MATNLPTQKLFSLVSLIFLLLPTNLNPAQALSFNFTKLTHSDSISNVILQGDAQFLPSGVLTLTRRSPFPPGEYFASTGRALTTIPIPLWDNATGEVASFVTSFTFDIETTRDSPTNGLIFFIAPVDSVIPNNSNGPYLGVVDSKTSINQFVGVEFDLYSYSWDPETRHIGIDINSLISTKTVRYNWENGSFTRVSIIYDSPSNALTAIVFYENNQFSTIAQVIDLKTVLPDAVRVGLSATSVTDVSYNIHSWSFTSDL
ncbi:nodule lectin-like [Vicia villosa]|uniref:nodule lectin-like n=1 Tax=Vicia villosa TaxID=3911 RepID=UPI00273BFA27|nr:nodule lectin-like [Vicia villosa]